MEKRPYVSPEYAKRLDELATSLMRHNYGHVALATTVEVPAIDVPSTVVAIEE